MRVLRPTLLLTGFVLALGGCVTPSIPIPPPDPARMEFTLTGDAANKSASFVYPPDINYEGSIVFIYNRDRGVGIIEAAHPDGSVGPTAPVRANVGEQMVVSFQREDQTVSTCVRLREGAQSSIDYCGP
ncbi:MAG: hypothetical protein IPQ07_05040 [Myxococcales bacterium]|nr:hypothetical protein [Myxococcales bacterium]